jgi:hypothetical protein
MCTLENEVNRKAAKVITPTIRILRLDISVAMTYVTVVPIITTLEGKLLDLYWDGMSSKKALGGRY